MIRSVKSEDAAAIAAIYNHYVQETTISFEVEPLSAEKMLVRIAQVAAEFPYLVWEEAGQVLGYAYAGQYRVREAYRWNTELSIYVDAAAHGRGVGKRLLRCLLALAIAAVSVIACGALAAPSSCL